MRCRHCGTGLRLPLVDLGSAPPSNAYLTAQTLRAPETWFPLRVLVCEACWLVQTEDFAQAEALFNADYAYFSGFSSSWLDHCERHVAAMTARLGLSAASHVVEVAANDGYLLQYVQQRGIPCTGIEPTASTAAAARAKGLPIVQAFFGATFAEGTGAVVGIGLVRNVSPLLAGFVYWGTKGGSIEAGSFQEAMQNAMCELGQNSQWPTVQSIIGGKLDLRSSSTGTAPTTCSGSNAASSNANALSLGAYMGSGY